MHKQLSEVYEVKSRTINGSQLESRLQVNSSQRSQQAICASLAAVLKSNEKYILYAIHSKFVSGFLLYFIFIPGVLF